MILPMRSGTPAPAEDPVSLVNRLFRDHPASVGETYVAHMRQAVSFGFTLIAAGLACLVHALVPGLFVRTASDCVRRLHHRMGSRRTAPNVPCPGPADVAH